MTTQETLEALFAKVRALPEPRQLAAIEALAEIAEVPHHLSEDELAVLKPALERARRGEFVPDDEVVELLDKTWR
jgi:predicted transcriptional regulator